jgi:broad specificity phosphatase PhoE
MQPPARVWLLRHAETATPTVFHGAESDVDLGTVGRRQAAAVADWFRPLGLTAVVSSGMRRAIDTAAPIAAACRVPHRVEPGLHERRVGPLCGTGFHPTEGPWADTVRAWAAGDTAFTTPGAESYDALRDRLLPAWERAVAGGGRVAVVAHGVVCKVLLLALLDGCGPRRWAELGRVANCAVSELVARPGGGWHPERILEVPDPVRAVTGVTADRPAGGGPPRSEA